MAYHFARKNLRKINIFFSVTTMECVPLPPLSPVEDCTKINERRLRLHDGIPPWRDQVPKL